MTETREARKQHATGAACAAAADEDPASILEGVRQDYHVLDRTTFVPPADVRLISHEPFDRREASWTDVEYVPRPRILTALLRETLLADLLYCLIILGRAGGRTAILCIGGSRVGKLTAILNHLLGLGRRIVLWESFVDAGSPISRALARWMVLGCWIVVVYSRKLVNLQAERTRTPRARFVFVPYKANHSTQAPIEMTIGNYVFAGGNSERDYRTLADAVRGTDIPVIISATDPTATRNADFPENVILLAAKEPYFARLMAASRFVVLPIKPRLVVGAANAGACNAMWHGKAVVAAEDSSLGDYIPEGETGYVVPSGDVAALRDRIQRLWDDPDLARRMGLCAHERVADDLTHEHFMRRLNRLAALVAASDSGASSSPAARGA